MSKVHYEYYRSVFGEVLIASVEDKVCFVHFCKEKEKEFKLLQHRIPADEYLRCDAPLHHTALDYVEGKTDSLPEIIIFGTPFQRNVLQHLLEIPRGKVVSYAMIARAVGNEKAVRAVANAIGSNPLEVLVPCHRVVRSDVLLADIEAVLTSSVVCLSANKREALSRVPLPIHHIICLLC